MDKETDRLFRKCSVNSSTTHKIEESRTDKFGWNWRKYGDRAIVLDFTCACCCSSSFSAGCWLAGPPHEEINIHITYLLNVREYKEYSVWRRARARFILYKCSVFPSTATWPCHFSGPLAVSAAQYVLRHRFVSPPGIRDGGKHSRRFLFFLYCSKDWREGYWLEFRLILVPSKKVRVNFPFCFGAWLDLQYYPTKLCVVGRIYKVHYFWSATSFRWSHGFSDRRRLGIIKLPIISPNLKLNHSSYGRLTILLFFYFCSYFHSNFLPLLLELRIWRNCSFHISTQMHPKLFGSISLAHSVADSFRKMNYFSLLLLRQFPLLGTIWTIFDVLENSTLLRQGAIGLKVDACCRRV